jgi:hypothetical protein
MLHNQTKQWRVWLLAGLLAGSGLAFSNCSGNKSSSESEGMSNSTGSDSSVFGRQGDTINSSLDAPIQAPPDSASARGAVVPAEIKVKAKK